MFLSKEEIVHQIALGGIQIDPIDDNLFKPASYTLRLPKETTLLPGQFTVLESLETISLSPQIGAMLSTRGSIAKQGIDALITDTIVEPGYSGKLSFCSKNSTSQQVSIPANSPYVKIVFFKIG